MEPTALSKLTALAAIGVTASGSDNIATSLMLDARSTASLE